METLLGLLAKPSSPSSLSHGVCDIDNSDNNNNTALAIAEEIAHALAFGVGELGPLLRSICLPLFGTAPKTNVVRGDNSGCIEDSYTLEGLSEGGSGEKKVIQLLSLKVLVACLDVIREKELDYLCNEVTMLDLYSCPASGTLFTKTSRSCFIRKVPQDTGVAPARSSSFPVHKNNSSPPDCESV
jgi:hypothetical protein